MKHTVLYLLLFLSSVVKAQTITWTGATDNDWHKGCNWSSSTIPTCLQDVVIPTAKTVDVSGIAHCKTLVLQGSANLNITGSGNLEVSDNNSCAGIATDNGGCASTIVAVDTYNMSCYGTWGGSGVKGAGANFIIKSDGTWVVNSGGTYSGPPNGTYSGTWLSGAPTTPVNVQWRLIEFQSTTPFNSPGSSWTSPVSTSAWGTVNVNANVATACGGGGGVNRYMGCKVEFRNATTLALIATHYWSVDMEC